MSLGGLGIVGAAMLKALSPQGAVVSPGGRGTRGWHHHLPESAGWSVAVEELRWVLWVMMRCLKWMR